MKTLIKNIGLLAGISDASRKEGAAIIVWVESREAEFEDKIRGLNYAEIAARGGILNSADLLHATSKDELYRQSLERVCEMMVKDSGAIERRWTLWSKWW